MKAEIIAVGSELLTPDRVDTNSLFLTAQLNRLGIEVTRKTVVGDDLAALAQRLRGIAQGASNSSLPAEALAPPKTIARATPWPICSDENSRAIPR